MNSDLEDYGSRYYKDRIENFDFLGLRSHQIIQIHQGYAEKCLVVKRGDKWIVWTNSLLVIGKQNGKLGQE